MVHSKHGGHVSRKVTLQGEYVRRFAAVLLAPDVAIVAGVYQFGADFEVVAALHHVPFEDGANAQRLSYGSRISVLPLVDKGGIPRHYPEVR
jgi:hypothetical protein